MRVLERWPKFWDIGLWQVEGERIAYAHGGLKSGTGEMNI